MHIRIFFNPLCTASIKSFRQLCFFWQLPRIIEGPGFTGKEEIVWFLVKKICFWPRIGSKPSGTIFTFEPDTQPLHVTFYNKQGRRINSKFGWAHFINKFTIKKLVGQVIIQDHLKEQALFLFWTKFEGAITPLPHVSDGPA